MKRPLKATTPDPQQPQRDSHLPLRLDQCGSVLTVRELCAVLQITERSYYRWARHGAFPIPKLNVPGDPRFSRTVVQRYLDGAPKFTRMLKAG